MDPLVIDIVSILMAVTLGVSINKAARAAKKKDICETVLYCTFALLMKMMMDSIASMR